MNAKVSVFIICVEAIIYLLLHNLHDLKSRQEYTQNISTKNYSSTEHELLVMNSLFPSFLWSS